MVNWFKSQLHQPSTARGLTLLGALAVMFPELDQPLSQLAGGITGVIALWAIIRRGRTWSEPGA